MSEHFVGYEYQDITVKRSMAAFYIDGYENFGWKLDGTRDPAGKPDAVTLSFKRDRKFRGKAELTRLQGQFDACMSEILSLEASKVVKASAAAYTVGVAGTAFMAASVFAYTAGLLRSVLSLGGAQQELYTIQGTVPTAGNFSVGCRFADRCEHCMDICCNRAPALSEISPGHLCRCWLHADTPKEETA